MNKYYMTNLIAWVCDHVAHHGTFPMEWCAVDTCELQDPEEEFVLSQREYIALLNVHVPALVRLLELVCRHNLKGVEEESP